MALLDHEHIFRPLRHRSLILFVLSAVALLFLSYPHAQPPATPPEDLDHGKSTADEYGAGGLLGGRIRILNGNVLEGRLDLKFPSPNRMGLSFSASYNSRSPLASPLGFGWTHGYAVSLDPEFHLGDGTCIKILDETGRGVYFMEANPGVFSGVYGER